MTQFHVWLRAEVGGSTQNCCGLVVGSIVGGGKTTMSLVKATQQALALVVTSLLIADPVASQVTGSDTAIIQIRPDRQWRIQGVFRVSRHPPFCLGALIRKEHILKTCR